MRYDNLLRSLERATVRYESEVRAVLQRFSKSDAETGEKILTSLKTKKRNGKHWTQTAKGKKLLKAKAAAKLR